MMQHDPRLHEAARAIYEAFYPSDEWAQFAFGEAERYGDRALPSGGGRRRR